MATQSNAVHERVHELVQRFTQILHTSMADMPINNAKLQVQAVEFKLDMQDNATLMGVLITPWFMNLIRLPVLKQTQIQSVGVSSECDLGATCLTFLSAYDDEIGEYKACSLASPVLEYDSQADAVLMAQTILQQLLHHQEQVPASPSRRGFLTGRRG